MSTTGRRFYMQRDRINRSVVELEEIWVESIGVDESRCLQVPDDVTNSTAMQCWSWRQSARQARRLLTPNEVTAPGTELRGLSVQRPSIPSRHAIATQYNTRIISGDDGCVNFHFWSLSNVSNNLIFRALFSNNIVGNFLRNIVLVTMSFVNCLIVFSLVVFFIFFDCIFFSAIILWWIKMSIVQIFDAIRPLNQFPLQNGIRYYMCLFIIKSVSSVY